MQAVLLVAVLLVMVFIRSQSDNVNEAVPVNQAAQILQNPHLVALPVFILVIYTLKQPEYHMELHRSLEKK